ncbi:MAG: hypothetical protein JSR41_06900 [Proteobacteria bacterium]|nr:hypothetical protein [Pseudomonadota bacterium]
MNGISGFVIVGTLALLAALATVLGENGMADVHLANAARGDVMMSLDALRAVGR